MKHALRRERGQTLIVIALVLTVLLLGAGLAVDVGMAYNERRDMQNAADAAALAGAQMWCDNNGANAGTQARRVAVDLNGADDAMTTVDSADFAVEVVAGTNSQTFLFRLAGVESVPVRARARAVCGCAEAAGAPWPILFDQADWDEMELGNCTPPTYLMVWSNDVKFEWSEDICSTYCNCDEARIRYGLPSDFFTNMTSYGTSGTESGDRGWARLDAPAGYTGFSGNPCGNTALAEWLEVGYQAPVGEANCVPGQPGTSWSEGVDSAIQLHHGDEVSVMLFDGTTTDVDSCVFPGNGGCTTGTSFYTISGLGCVKVLNSDPGFSMYEWGATSGPKCKAPNVVDASPEMVTVTDSVILAELSCGGCDTSGSGSGEPTPPWEGCITSASLTD